MTRDDIGPTDQTRAKLRPDPLRAQLLAGRIGQDDYDVALAIRAGFENITAALRAKGQWSIGIWSYPDAREGDPKIVQFYRDWCETMRRRRWPVKDVLDAIEAADWRIGTARIRRSLRLYVTANGRGWRRGLDRGRDSD